MNRRVAIVAALAALLLAACATGPAAHKLGYKYLENRGASGSHEWLAPCCQ